MVLFKKPGPVYETGMTEAVSIQEQTWRQFLKEAVLEEAKHPEISMFPTRSSAKPPSPERNSIEHFEPLDPYWPHLIISEAPNGKIETTANDTKGNLPLSSLQGAELRSTARSLLQSMAVLENNVHEIEGARARLLDEVSRLETQRDECKREAEELARKLAPYLNGGQGGIRARLRNLEAQFRGVLVENEQLRGENRRLKSQFKALESNPASFTGETFGLTNSSEQIGLRTNHQSFGWERTSSQSGMLFRRSGATDQTDSIRRSAAPSLTQKVGLRPKASNEEIGGLA
jgi:hypothetical protein